MKLNFMAADPLEKGKELLKTYGFENPGRIINKHTYEKDYYLPLNLGDRRMIIHYTKKRYLDSYCRDRFVLLENQELRVTEKNISID